MDSDFSLIDLFLHLDKHLAVVIQDYGVWTYAILFIIILCETGLVVTPFLPGDSLLFAAGALSSQGGMNVHLLAGLLLIAAVVGDAINYAIGAYLGPKAFQNPKSKIFRKEYLEITQRYYERYGASTIIIARFAPIVRTFAPFLAGMGEMNYGKFALYNITGAALWVGLLTYAGYFFGNLAIVKNNFSIVVLGIVALSVLIPALKFLKEKKSSGHAATNNI